MKSIGSMLIVVLICAVSPLLAGELKPAPASGHAESRENSFTYLSTRGEKLVVSYDKQSDSVALTLPDGSQARLPRTMSGSGARYADAQERMIFWVHQGVASVWVGEKLIFKGAESSQNP